MGHADDEYDQFFIPNCVDNPVLADADAPQVFHAVQSCASSRPRVHAQRIGRGRDPFLDGRRQHSQRLSAEGLNDTL